MPMTPTELSSIGLLEEVTIGPARSAPRVDIGRELDGHRPVFGLGLSQHGFQEALGVAVIVTAADFNDARQERDLALVILPTPYATVHHVGHSIAS
jgi:hypothetical protein